MVRASVAPAPAGAGAGVVVVVVYVYVFVYTNEYKCFARAEMRFIQSRRVLRGNPIQKPLRLHQRTLRGSNKPLRPPPVGGAVRQQHDAVLVRPGAGGVRELPVGRVRRGGAVRDARGVRAGRVRARSVPAGARLGGVQSAVRAVLLEPGVPALRRVHVGRVRRRRAVRHGRGV